jgi:hypothetical protein
MRVPTMAPTEREATAHCGREGESDSGKVRERKERKETHFRLDVVQFVSESVSDVGESSTDAGCVPSEKKTGETTLQGRAAVGKGQHRSSSERRKR